MTRVLVVEDSPTQASELLFLLEDAVAASAAAVAPKTLTAPFSEWAARLRRVASPAAMAFFNSATSDFASSRKIRITVRRRSSRPPNRCTSAFLSSMRAARSPSSQRPKPSWGRRFGSTG